ncbi:MAG: response regulator [Actinobacteria bacterium]|nr:response regulator [Actinomycetota bacterium]
MNRPTRVLLVDDNPVILDLLVLNFELEGFTVLQARDGAQALGLAREERPDVVVSDVMMPEMDGLKLTAALRADPVTSAIPVMLVSAEAQASDIRAGLAAGAGDYVTKPFDPFELIDRVNRLLVASHR